jgi:Ner family transcriptional regulator
MTKTEPVKWDRHDIKAEIERRRLTLTGIAKAAGLGESACRHGLNGSNSRGAKAIAKALGIPFRTLFPNSYPRVRDDEPKTTRKATGRTSAKEHVRADTARGAA